MRRRDFLRLLGGVAASPLAATAQGRVPLIGILDPDVPWIFNAFVESMRDLGYVDGRNIVYARKSIHGNNDAVPALVADLVDMKADMIVTVAPYYVRAIRQAAPSIPIVFLAAGDPVSARIVDSLAHPGGRVTGLSFADDDLSTKRLDLLRQMVPHLRDVAVFYASSSRKNTAYERTERTAHALGLEVRGWAIASTFSRRPFSTSTPTASFSRDLRRNIACRRSTNPANMSAPAA
jgi:putative ABC transport system substrate-binding protein